MIKGTDPIEALPFPVLHMNQIILGEHLWQDLFLLLPSIDRQFFHQLTMANQNDHIIACKNMPGFFGRT